MKNFVSMRRKFQLAILGIVGVALLTLSLITLIVLSSLISRFTALSEQQNQMEKERLQMDSEEAQKRFVELYTQNLRRKSASLLAKDSIALRTPFIENSATYVRDFLIDSTKEDVDIWSASFLVVDEDGIKAWQYVNRNYPDGLGFNISYDRKRKAWISQVDGKRVEIQDPDVEAAIDIKEANVRTIEVPSDDKKMEALQAIIPVYEGDLAQLRKNGEPVGYLRYILSLEGLQKEIEREHRRLEERLQEQNIEQERAKTKIKSEVRLMVLLSLSFLLLGAFGVTALGIAGASFISKKLTGSLSVLMKATRQVAEGDLKTEIQVQSNDEIGLLGEAFDQMRVNLAEKERARTLFFHNTSHELRTPLNGIMGYLDLTCQGRFGEITNLTRTQLQKALRLAESLKYQVNTILDLAKSKKGELEICNSQIDLKILKQDADNLAEGLLLKTEGASYSSEFQVAPDQLNFISDREKIFTILRNLLGNAFKFHDPARKNVVSLQISRDKSGLTICVRDQGIGIPESYLQKIFEEFSQVEGDARRNYEGTGLGLAMVKGIVEALQGTITVQSQVGEGSQFLIQIPEQAEVSLYSGTEESIHLPETRESTASPEIADSFTPRAVSKDGTGLKLLVIDDNPNNCDVISQTLQMADYEVHTCLSGQAGLKFMSQHKPDLLLLDMMMPGMSGEDVIRAMKEQIELRDIPIILITARASDEDRILGLRLGADDYLAKPILQDEMLLRVKNHLERKQLTVKIQQQEANARMVQLGEMFGDLSHEIKNILQNASETLQSRDVSLLLLATVIPEQHRDTFAEAMVGDITSDYMERMNLLNIPSTAGAKTTLRKLRALLSEVQIPLETLQDIWQHVIKEGEADLMFLENALKILSNFRMAMNLNKRTRDLSLAVLDFTREDESVVVANFLTTLKQTKLILHTKLNRAACRVTVLSPRDINLTISPGSLMQILLNLLSNAVDAMSQLPLDQRWVQVEVLSETQPIRIKVTNAGEPIPDAIAERIFDRGFSTKGEKGSGIGLPVSLRLAHEVGGQLSLDRTAAHPCFVLSLEEAHVHEQSVQSA